MYEYRMRVVKVIDGDTLDAELDLGFYLKSTLRLKLAGVNAPDLERPGGVEARKYLMDWLAAHAVCGDPLMPFIVKTKRADSFGRWLGEIICHKGHNLNKELRVCLQNLDRT